MRRLGGLIDVVELGRRGGEQQVFGEGELVGATFQEVHQVSRGVGERDEVTGGDAGGELGFAEGDQVGFGAVGTDQIPSECGAGAGILRMRDEQGIDEEVVAGGAALGAVHG